MTAMICPGCKRTISKPIPRCPMCGENLESSPEGIASPPQEEEIASPEYWGRYIAGFVFLIALAAAGFSFYLVEGKNDHPVRDEDSYVPPIEPVLEITPEIEVEQVDDPSNVVDSSDETTPAAPNVASVNGKSLEFPHQLALLKDNGFEILIVLSRVPLDPAIIEQIKKLPTSAELSNLLADVTVRLKFKRNSVGCSAEDLSSYYVTFLRSSEGFKLPDNKTSMEIARAVTNARSQEGIGLSCERKDGKDLVVMLNGAAGKSANIETAPYTWNLAFKTTLMAAE